jgi:enoyl-[acyl-carrier protein] reductase III
MSSKCAVVTGGTRGIGLEISLALARSGCRVYAVYARNREAAKRLSEKALAAELDIRCVRADLTDKDAIARCIAAIKSETKLVDIVVHSAASGVHRKVFQLSVKHLVWTYSINVFAIHHLLSELIPIMPRGGRVLAITSEGASHVLPFYAAIGSSKGSLDSLFRYYAHELAPHGIAVNVLSPGLVLTDAIEAFPDCDQRVRLSTANTPSGRLTTPEDVAGVVLFMCSEAAAQIVGQTIVIDGGKCLA